MGPSDEPLFIARPFRVNLMEAVDPSLTNSEVPPTAPAIIRVAITVVIAAAIAISISPAVEISVSILRAIAAQGVAVLAGVVVIVANFPNPILAAVAITIAIAIVIGYAIDLIPIIAGPPPRPIVSVSVATIWVIVRIVVYVLEPVAQYPFDILLIIAARAIVLRILEPFLVSLAVIFAISALAPHPYQVAVYPISIAGHVFVADASAAVVAAFAVASIVPEQISVALQSLLIPLDLVIVIGGGCGRRTK
jgi:hypothetical protein